MPQFSIPSPRDNFEYLLRVYFGNDPDPLSACIQRAYRDFNRTLRRFANSTFTGSSGARGCGPALTGLRPFGRPITLGVAQGCVRSALRSYQVSKLQGTDKSVPFRSTAKSKRGVSHRLTSPRDKRMSQKQFLAASHSSNESANYLVAPFLRYAYLYPEWSRGKESTVQVLWTKQIMRCGTIKSRRS
jgi:hypothetical protein